MQRRIADRRRLWDRRSGDRPSSTGDDRRAAATRRRRERRCTTPIPYSPEQQAELQIRFAASGPVSCPACGGGYTLGPAHRANGRIERLVLCVSCRRGTVIQDGAAARVLVVSAVAPLRGLLREMLTGAGHEVIEADDAAVGLDAAENAALLATAILALKYPELNERLAAYRAKWREEPAPSGAPTR